MATYRLALAVLVALAVLGGCSHKEAPRPEAATETAATEPGEGEHDPCALIEPKEAEAALGAPLATPPFRYGTGKPSAGGDTCVYQDSHFHNIQVSVDWDGGAMVWKMMGTFGSMANKGPAKGMLHLADGSDISGEWDEARVQNCCTFKALRGDQIVTVDFGGTVGTQVAQAAQLADAGLKRLEQPLSIDGAAAVAAALAYDKAHRPTRLDPCALLPRADLEALLRAPLSADPTSKGEVCTYMQGNQKLAPEIDVRVQWTDGFRKLREDAALIRGFNKNFIPRDVQQATGVTADAEPKPDVNPAWEVAAPSVSMGMRGVRDDALVEVNVFGMNHEQTLALLAKAMSGLKLNSAP